MITEQEEAAARTSPQDAARSVLSERKAPACKKQHEAGEQRRARLGREQLSNGAKSERWVRAEAVG